MFHSAIAKKMFKPFFLVFLILGYQSAALCATFWDFLFGGTAVAGLAYGYFNYRRYSAYKNRFKDYERILTIHERLQELAATPLGNAALAAYEKALASEKSNAIDAVLVKLFAESGEQKQGQSPLSRQAQWHSFLFPERYEKYEQELARDNEQLKSFKKKLGPEVRLGRPMRRKNC